MDQHPALTPGRTAVVTGAASGIGFAVARRFALMGLRVCLVDREGDALGRALEDLARLAEGRGAGVLAVPTDVARLGRTAPPRRRAARCR
jgi:NAD(P)-dependent dehydrogenase (short-subunit alcohol dehydrogenase family)